MSQYRMLVYDGAKLCAGDWFSYAEILFVLGFSYAKLGSRIITVKIESDNGEIVTIDDFLKEHASGIWIEERQ